VAVSLGHGITDLYQNSLFIILPYLSKDLGLTYGQVGLLMGWNYFTNFFVNLPADSSWIWWGKPDYFSFGHGPHGYPYFFLGFSSSYVMAMVLITFVGIGNNLWHPAALSLLARRFPERKGFAISLHGMGGHLGNTLAPILIGVALTFLIWRQVLLLSLFPGLIMGFVLWRILAKVGRSEPKGGGKGSPWGLRKRREGHGSEQKCPPSLFHGRNAFHDIDRAFHILAHLPRSRAALFSGADRNLRDRCPGSRDFRVFSLGTISDRKGRRPVLTAGLVTTSFLLVALAILKLQFLFVAVLAVLGFFLFSLQPVILAWMMDVAPKDVSGPL